ncbi:hypothetical protein HDU92_007040 [Lobulomyces angularis]|nr:hypothetical protein HDU92_007040 [Lobulomyces angularis]
MNNNKIPCVIFKRTTDLSHKRSHTSHQTSSTSLKNSIINLVKNFSYQELPTSIGKNRFEDLELDITEYKEKLIIKTRSLSQSKADEENNHSVMMSNNFENRRKSISAMFSIFVIICNAIMSNSMLSIPYTFASTGLALGPILLIISGLTTTYTVKLLIDCADVAYYENAKQDCSTPSINDLAIATFKDIPLLGPLLSNLLNISAVIFGVGNAVASLIAVGDSSSQILMGLFNKSETSNFNFLEQIFYSRIFWILCFTLISIKSVTRGSFESYSHFSALTLGLFIYISVIIIRNSFMKTEEEKKVLEYFIFNENIIPVLSIFVVAFSFHLFSLQLYHEVNVIWI